MAHRGTGSRVVGEVDVQKFNQDTKRGRTYSETVEADRYESLHDVIAKLFVPDKGEEVFVFDDTKQSVPWSTEWGRLQFPITILMLKRSFVPMTAIGLSKAHTFRR
jgi:hypothetical protein